jgi:hypothetical protein
MNDAQGQRILEWVEVAVVVEQCGESRVGPRW